MPDRPGTGDIGLTDARIDGVLRNGGHIFRTAYVGTTAQWLLIEAGGEAMGWLNNEYVLWCVANLRMKMFDSSYDPDVCHKCLVKLEPKPPSCNGCEKPATMITDTDNACDDCMPNGETDGEG